MEFSYLWGTLSVVKLYYLSYFVGLMVLGLAVWFGVVGLGWVGLVGLVGLGWVGFVGLAWREKVNQKGFGR